MSRNLKLKVLGLGVLAALVVSGVSVISASALTGGHFTSEVEHTTLHGADHEGGLHVSQNGATVFTCKEVTYEGTVTNLTVTEVTIAPIFPVGKCTNPEFAYHIHMNGCDYVFTIGKKAHEDNTTHLLCPGTKGPEVTMTGPFGTCTISLTLNQTPKGGISYTTVGSGSTHNVTADFILKGIHVEYLGGIFFCGFSKGTTSEWELSGEVTAKGFNTAGEQVGITATGSEGT